MAGHVSTDIDPRQIAEAQAFWQRFLNVSKWSIVVIAATLVALALAFVRG